MLLVNHEVKIVTITHNKYINCISQRDKTNLFIIQNYVIMKDKKFHNLLSASWRPREVSGVVPVHL